MAQTLDEKYPYITQGIKELEDTQIAGLIALLALAVVREKTSVFQQWQKLGFNDVPEKLVAQIDNEMGDRDKISLVQSLAWKAYMNILMKGWQDIKPPKFEDIPMPEFNLPKDWQAFLNSDINNDET